jgi:hypothetical protein
LIYKEWFFKLNFPGREHTKIVDGVPEGWAAGAISNFYRGPLNIVFFKEKMTSLDKET